MRCPRCNFVGDLVDGACAQCGYRRGDSFSFGSRYTLSSRPLTVIRVKRGDVLHQGRYRLVEQLSLPENQQGQGTAWLATDSQSPTGRVIIREVILPEESPENKSQAVRLIALHLSELAQHPGFPRVIDVFSEQDDYFIVLQHIEGDSLATVLKQQGGALPERMVAEFGRQLCEMLSILARHQPPIVHGSISPETIIVSRDRSRVSLIQVPLLPPKEPVMSMTNAASGYRAPEQARGNIEPSSDLYVVAVTLHYAVTGYDPSERMTFFHPPARRLNPTVTPRMEAILAQQLRLSVAQRYARPSDMQKDLSALITSYRNDSDRLVAPTTAPLGLDSIQLRQRSRNRSLLDIGIFAAVGIIILFGFLLVSLRPFAGTSATPASPTPNVTATSLARQQAELALEMQTYQKKGIGISDGRFAFDIYAGRNDINEKKLAAQAIQHNDLSSAVELLRKATTEDPIDGEAQIYNEDVHLLQSGAPDVTIVLGLPIDGSDADLSIDRNDMESAFLVQHKVNVDNLLPGGLKLRILVDSSGAKNDDVGTVAQFIANRVKSGNLDHIIAVVGWPYSTQTINARDIIASVHVPLISQSASSVTLTGSSPYFFRVNPPDDQQGKTLGDLAVSQLGDKTILVLRDKTDSYSVSLADAFIADVKAHNGIAINNPDDYFSETNTTVAQYQRVVADAVGNRVNLIFIAGLDVDAVRLAVAVGNAYRANPTPYLGSLRILGGDAVDTGLLLGQVNGPDAQLALQFPQDVQRLIFTAFGHPDEWSFLKIPQNQQPSFLGDWSKTYQSSSVTAPAPGNDAILTYDAFCVIVRASSLVHGSLTGQAIRDALASLGTGTLPPYQGVSGQIHFDANGNPVDKAIVVLQVEDRNGANQIVLLQVAGKFN